MGRRRWIAALGVLGSLVLPISGRAAASNASLVVPPSVTFPEVTLPVFDVGPRQDVTVHNDTASTVRVGVPTIEGPSAALFRVLGGGGPQTVYPGGTATFTVEFLPVVAGAYHADLLFSTTDPDNGTVVIDLAGTARSVVVLGGNLAGYRFVPLSPARVLDSRSGLGWSGAVPADGTRVLQLPPGTIDASAGAVVLNVTATNTAAPGYVTVWPAGKPQPVASSLNIETAGQTIANLVTVGLGASSTVAFYSKSAADLVADIAGYYLPSAATSAGRYQAVIPARLLDTREPAGGGAFAADEERELAVAGAGGVPPSGVSAVMLNVTATDTGGPGFLTVWPASVARPTASNVNPDRAGQTIANQVVVTLPASGRLRIYSHQRSDVLVDVVGWFTDPTASSDVVGLFFPIGPLRMLDTRDDGTTPGAGGTVSVDTTPVGVSVDATAVTANVTVASAKAPGFVTAWSGVGPVPLASNLNVDRAGQTIPNQVTSPLAAGKFSLYVHQGADLVVDVTGFYRGVARTSFAAG